VEYVDLVNLDLEKFNDPVSRKELAKDLLHAVTEHGFFTITNHGISDELWDHQMDVSNAIMHLSQEDKKPYEGREPI
jgi:isopenicillin N synthase-like dioxygenase